MLRFYIIFSLFLHSCVAVHKTPAAAAAVPTKKWLTLNGQEPAVVARGGFSGLFPESSASANALAISTSSSGLTMLCNLQMTNDGVGLCLPDIRLDNSTTISTLFPKGQKTYKVNGQDLKGWFALDYSADTIFSNVSLVQNILSRPSIFDGQMPISAVEDVLGTKPPKFWLSVQYDSFYTEHKLSAAEYLKTLRFRRINFISSPEIAFLKTIGMDVGSANTKLIFEFKDPEAIEPTTNKKYSELLLNLAAIKAFASGVLVPKDYIWPLDSANYLKPATTFVADAHKAGLEVYASGFANDLRTSFNYSYDPSAEYLQFVDNDQFSVDGFVTDFPPTASQAISCLSHQKGNLPKANHALVITHNGASGDYPGCTDLAYQKAVDDGADVIDCSVQMSKDGITFCHDSADLTASTNAMTTFMSRATSVPEIQPTNGIFSFDLTWAEIQSLKPQIQSPFLTKGGFQRNPLNKNAGKFMTLAVFLEFSKAKAVTGVLINIQNAAYLASKKGLGIVDSVKSAVTKSTLDKQLTQKVLIQSDDSSVLSGFPGVPPFTRVLTIGKEIGDAPKPSVDEIKKHAEAVNLMRSSLVTTSESFATGKTNVVEEMHKGNVSVYVSVLRNEYLSIAFDYFSDPTVELATFIAGNGVDGVVTEFPATATRYLRSPCSDLNKEQPYAILPAEAGALLSVAAKEAQPPVSAPNPPLDPKDVIDPPLPPVANIVSANATGEASQHASGTIATSANLGLSLLAILVLGLLFAAE
ncbi:Glycerophosphodiester phosphodiesterase GDPDL7 [Raphanus sativus]|uniref:glycerophosphodiester phosphodiesterase n=1 Tax=Raphanus sativus TaxID=3726 RepID=A0A9W3DB27_RAPSA|nr:glycerophosphodiester phosphodiesterase GDPDL7-like [Raphanus sativus]KAJ4907832.1 Glycerophosphodiester phosphodiesterase GDPDL7 [Raphanus sativus]